MSYVTSATQVKHFHPVPPFHKFQLSPNCSDLSLNSTSLDRFFFLDLPYQYTNVFTSHGEIG